MFDWHVAHATLDLRIAQTDPRSIVKVLTQLDDDGWEIVSIVSVPSSTYQRYTGAYVIAKKAK